MHFFINYYTLSCWLSVTSVGVCHDFETRELAFVHVLG